jgi:preprotein translocase subunit Sec63
VGFAIRLIAILFVVMLVVRLLRRVSRAVLPDKSPTRRSTKRRQTSSPYELLGVEPDASQQQIRAAYQRLVRQYHPDRVANMAPEIRQLAEQRTKEINAAYEQLDRGR